MIWFTSDTHFGHTNVLSFSHRPWETIEAMNEGLVRNINALVAVTDDLYILGDFSFKIPAEAARTIRNMIYCRHVHLIPGNHDKDWTQPNLKGTFICEPPICQLKADGHKLVLSHYPLMDWPSMAHGSIMLHGHIHSAGPAYNSLNRMQGIYRYDVGVDANLYSPISLEEILAWFDGIECAGMVDWKRWAVVQDDCAGH